MSNVISHPFRDSCPDCPQKNQTIEQLRRENQQYREKEDKKSNARLVAIMSFLTFQVAATVGIYLGVEIYWAYDKGLCAALCALDILFFGVMGIVSTIVFFKYMAKAIGL